MTEHTFNLIDNGWIHVQSGNDLQSLRQIFTRLELRRLSGNPVEKIAILRLLLAITHAAVSLPNRKAWLQLSLQDLSDIVCSYLDSWHDRFFLHGEQPFMQFRQLDQGKTSPFSVAQLNVATGNKVVLNSWNMPTPIDPPGKVMALLRQSFFACSGKKFDNDIALSPGHAKKPSGTYGTLTGFCGYLHTYLLGETLLDTVKNNLLTDDDLKQLPFAGLGRPFWEDMPDGELSKRAQGYKSSYQGQLLPMDKFVFLKEDGMVMTEGITYDTYKTGLVDPAITMRQDGKDIKTVWAKTDKKPWRELTALLAFLKLDAINKSPHFLSMGLEKLAYSQGIVMRFWTGGMQLSSNAGEQYISGMDDYVESEFHIPISVSTQGGFDFFQQMITELERLAKITYSSVVNYYDILNTEQKVANALVAASKFWEAMEPRAQLILDLAFSCSADKQPKIEEEMNVWRKTVLRVYNQSCAKDSARQMTAWVKASPKFSAQTKKGK
ncbi:type I-E CRISPR-associated protein Cse1/CasA [Oligosphaera ethanolica]|uniref:CRISPR system Cascade subunit CasA n=1 Tax=Oligosphaera ethanolica TaxID=760260 RepID=A0AAE4AMC4_9BACT|nr:type I-E CRISPR-associated protein Cse1/CasA [Oligosphaera ethanolica]MDQ0288265.1 CRISPR system Cascade subunit CasA [Oligosphaera ethanolica]